MELPFEREAMSGSPLPSGLSAEDQLMYLSLRNLYDAYRRGLVSRENATAEKGKLVYEHGRRSRLRDQRLRESKHTAAMWAGISQYTAAYRKERSLETADKLLGAIEGHVHKWEGFENGKD